MKEIEVLSLEGGCLSLQSLEFSTNLQSLLLIRCKCNDLISLRKLQRLKILCFTCLSSLEELPDEIGELKELRLLDVTGCRDTRTLFPAKWRQALNNQTSVKIEDCKSLEEVFELLPEGSSEVKELRLLSSLTRLELKLLPELKCIWKGPTRHVSLRSLIHLELRGLNKLTFIFTPHLAQSLVHLETLRIYDCSGLKHLIREKDDESEIIPDSLGFPKLKTLSIRGCDQLEYVFPVSVSPSLLNLQEMKIVFGASLKQIFYRGEGDAITRDGIINFPQLRKLTLLSCSFFGPKNFTAQLPSLQVLYIQEHEELGDLLAQLQVGSFVTNTRTRHEFSLLSLEKLDLSFLSDMRCILKGLVLSHLTTLKVSYCEKLTHVFTSSMVASLVQLQFLDISACEELEQIIAKDNDDEKDQILYGRYLESLCFPNLCKVEIKGCNKLRSLFPRAMASVAEDSSAGCSEPIKVDKRKKMEVKMVW
ncbi:hypothetical protein OIU85_002739 [Salix viminalis]|uniref:Disease resistance protein At4g27190-like leucine-rich repeats domain-containing protein n=1 Tax=Salix viminalis TaxID=40686 RepID=A0A9Q0ZZJ1_SALVM|nr:hypothetical protein OIU85_002739 [Salix viminalis]